MNQGPIHALLIEDDERLAELTREYLEKHGVITSWEARGDTGLAAALRDSYDLVLLDLMLPGKTGIEVCQRIREQSDVPLIMLTARGEEADRVLGLEIGADDYLAKPFSPRELLARIRALLRRSRGRAGPKKSLLRCGPLSLDPGTYRAKLEGRDLGLTSYEFGLLQVLAERAGRVLSREQLMDLAKGNSEEAFDRSVDVHISRLRHKLGDDPRQPRFIRTIRGVGYQLIIGAPE